MALLTVAAVWVAVSVPLALLAGRLLHATNPGLVSEIEAYLRRGRRRPLRRIAGMTATFLLLGGAAASATVATSRLPVVRSITDWAFDDVTAEPPAPTTATSVPVSQETAGVPDDDDVENAAPATLDAPAPAPGPTEPPTLTELLLEGALAAEVPELVEVHEHEHEHEPTSIPQVTVPVVLGPVAEDGPVAQEPAPAAEPEPEPTPEPEPEPTAEPEPSDAEPTEPEPAPEPAPTEPEPVLVEPEPVLVEPEPVLVEPEPLPTEPEPEPVLVEPEPVLDEPVFVAPEVIQPIPLSGFPDVDLYIEPEPTETLEAPN